MEPMRDSITVVSNSEIRARYCRSKKLLLDNCGVVYPLRNQSLKVLQLLAENHGTMLSKAAIHEAIWPTVAVTDDSLVQCISEIRKALDDRNRSILKTIPRQGYLLTHVAFVPEQPAKISEYVTDSIRWNPIDYFKAETISSRTILFRTTAALGLAFISLLGLSAVMSTDASKAPDPRAAQVADFALAKMTARKIPPSELSQREYQEHGMPYWNNKFLWDGYYDDGP